MIAEKVKTNEETKINNEDEQNIDYGVMDLIECPDGEQAKDAIESILDVKKIEFAPEALDTNSNNVNLQASYQKTKLISTTKEKLTKLLVEKRELLEANWKSNRGSICYGIM